MSSAPDPSVRIYLKRSALLRRDGILLESEHIFGDSVSESRILFYFVRITGTQIATAGIVSVIQKPV